MVVVEGRHAHRVATRGERARPPRRRVTRHPLDGHHVVERLVARELDAPLGRHRRPAEAVRGAHVEGLARGEHALGGRRHPLGLRRELAVGLPRVAGLLDGAVARAEDVLALGRADPHAPAVRGEARDVTEVLVREPAVDATHEGRRVAERHGDERRPFAALHGAHAHARCAAEQGRRVRGGHPRRRRERRREEEHLRALVEGDPGAVREEKLRAALFAHADPRAAGEHLARAPRERLLPLGEGDLDLAADPQEPHLVGPERRLRRRGRGGRRARARHRKDDSLRSGALGRGLREGRRADARRDRQRDDEAPEATREHPLQPRVTSDHWRLDDRPGGDPSDRGRCSVSRRAALGESVPPRFQRAARVWTKPRGFERSECHHPPRATDRERLFCAR